MDTLFHHFLGQGTGEEDKKGGGGAFTEGSIYR